MKTPAFLLVTVLFMIFSIAYSQSITNSSFEDWSTIVHFENPQQYNSTNILSYSSAGVANVVKSTDAQSGNYALQVETLEINGEVIEGAIFIGDISEENISGGIPFDEKPDSLKGFAKYDVMNNDTAYVTVIFKRFGAPMGICFARFYGTQNSYEEFSAPTQWLLPFLTPDSIVVAIISSTIFSESIPGSTLTVDNISFVGASNPFPNGNFENWDEFSSEEPDGWFTSNILGLTINETSVTKSSDCHEGNFAARIESAVTIFEDTLGIITNGTMGEDNPIGGMPVDSTPDILSGYYKYMPVGPDTAVGGMFLYYYNENTGNAELLEEVLIKLPPAEEYTYFEIESDYFSLPEPDTVNIAFVSGNVIEENSYTGLGSVLFVDALQITYKPHLVGIETPEKEVVHQVYPNPVTEKIYIEFKEIIQNEILVTITDVNGVLVYQKKIKPLAKIPSDISVRDFSPGLYFYNAVVGNHSYTGKFIVK